MKVVLFSGGRGSSVLSKQLIRRPEIDLTIVINGYDDGLSTGEVRRFLGDSLGPSDFRKNVSRLAPELRGCSPALLEIAELRFPEGCGVEEGTACLRALRGEESPRPGFASLLVSLLDEIEPERRAPVVDSFRRLGEELARKGGAFSFSDCSVGNLIFAGTYLREGRSFNAAVAAYAALFGLREGTVENVTDGANAWLVALDRDERLLGSEAEIVDASARPRIREIFLIDRPLSPDERDRLNAAGIGAIREFLEEHEARPVANPEVLRRLAEADLVISAPGTQHSSLFPSYLTPGVGEAIAGNVSAIKVLITNIQQDAEIGDSSAVDIVDRAVWYLREKGRRKIPTPWLITHYLINDPAHAERDVPYVPLGRLDTLEDPRLVRIGDYEDGASGRHDAAAVLAPFITSLLTKQRYRVGVLLLETESLNLVSQTMLEMVRAGIANVDASLAVLYRSPEGLDPASARRLPFETRNVFEPGRDPDESWRAVLDDESFDYFVLFESSGMYRGEDVVNLVSLLTPGTLDAVWGSRRLSLSDIRESYRLRYRRNFLLGAVSYVGSHLLSLAYLLLYGRYVSDTLSGARAVRARFLRADAIEVGDKRMNHRLLSRLLAERAGVFETPVRFFSLSPARVRRTTPLDGLQSLGVIVAWKARSLWARRAPRSSDEQGVTRVRRVGTG